MSRPKMIYLEDEQNILDFHQKMTGGKLVVPYLTYDQLNTQNLPQIDSYDLKIKCYNNGVYKVCWYKNLRKKSNTNLTLKFNLEKRLKMSKKELEELE
ncbi:hypothetical protein MU453_13795, partial [Staphylococcus aureus]|nr:hypothetical protein [Staphylococcus aureus]